MLRGWSPFGSLTSMVSAGGVGVVLVPSFGSFSRLPASAKFLVNPLLKQGLRSFSGPRHSKDQEGLWILMRVNDSPFYKAEGACLILDSPEACSFCSSYIAYAV